MTARLACFAVLAVVGCGSEAPAPEPKPVAVDVAPARPTPGQPIRITFHTPYALGDRTRNGNRTPPGHYSRSVLDGDNYHVVVEGPGGSRCNDALHFALGYVAERRRTAKRTVTITPQRKPVPSPRRANATWCPGRYTGRVEFRQPERSPHIPFETLGRFQFTVSR